MAQKQVDIAKSQFISLPEILQFDFVPSALFEGEFTVKHLLTTGLEKLLLSTEYNLPSKSKASLVLDFISPMRRINLTNLLPCKDGFEVMWKSIISACVLNQLNTVYNSYIIESIRYGKREWQAFSTETIMFVILQQTLAIPL